jgi:hypothetical protein
VELVRPHLLRTELVRRAVVELREARDLEDVGLDGARRAVSELQVIDHSLAQGRHDRPPSWEASSIA